MKKFTISCLMLLCLCGAAFAQNDLQVLSVVKLTKSESITVKQLKARCTIFEKQNGKKLTVDERIQVLKSLKEEKLVLQAAAKAGISIPDSAVDQYFLQTMSASVGANVTEKQLNELLQKQQGKTLDQVLLEQIGMNVVDYKAFMKNQLMAQNYVVQQNQKEIQNIAATDQEINRFYDSNKSNFVQTDMVKVFMVIVPKTNNPEASKTKINDLKTKYTNKTYSVAKFVEEANKDNSGFQAGEILIPKNEQYAASMGISYDLLNKLFSQSAGYITDATETNVDWRFIVVQKKYAAKILTLKDLVQPESTVTVYDYIKANLTQQKQMEFLQVAAQKIADDLNKPENVEDKKTGDALKKLLSWGN